MSHKRSDDLVMQVLAKYSEYFEVMGDESADFLIKILANMLADQIEKNEYLERRLKYEESREYTAIYR